MITTIEKQTASQKEAQTITTEIWNTGSSAEVMFQMLWESARWRGNIRNFAPHLRLFAAWCARRTSHLLTDSKSYHAIQIAERFATATASCSLMHEARRAAEAVIIQIAAAAAPETLISNASTQPTTQLTNQTINKIDTTATRTASILNAASAAATCCLTYQPLAPLKAAELCAKYARQSLYWEALTNGSDVVLITELLEEEDLRQSHTLRVLLGNPFDPDKSPPMFLPEPLPESL